MSPTTQNYYEGMFKKNVKNGRGRYYHLTTGQIQEGIWYNDQARVTWMWDDKKRRDKAECKTPFPIPELHLKVPHVIFLETAHEMLEQAKQL